MSRSWPLRSSRWLWVATLAACGGATPPPTTAPTTLPAEVRLADAKPLGELTPGELQANFTDKLSPPQTADHTVYFGEVDQYDGPDEDAKLTSSLPILAVKDGDDWKAVPLVGRGLANAGWRYVGAGPKPREAWGVLDASAGDPGPEFTVAHSTDGGATFALTSFRKPCPQATVYDFVLSREGHGRITLSLDAAVGRHKPGLYHYDTTDGGRTWAVKPRFEADGMTRGESVPDDEQPDPAVDHGGKGKTNLRGDGPTGATVRPAVDDDARRATAG